MWRLEGCCWLHFRLSRWWNSAIKLLVHRRALRSVFSCERGSRRTSSSGERKSGRSSRSSWAVVNHLVWLGTSVSSTLIFWHDSNSSKSLILALLSHLLWMRAGVALFRTLAIKGIKRDIWAIGSQMREVKRAFSSFKATVAEDRCFIPKQTQVTWLQCPRTFEAISKVWRSRSRQAYPSIWSWCRSMSLLTMRLFDWRTHLQDSFSTRRLALTAPSGTS